VAERRRKVAEMYLTGTTQAEIGKAVGVSRQTIHVDLKHIHADWLKSALMPFDKLKARELARIDRLEREHWAAWDRSQKEYQATLTEKKEGSDSKDDYTKAQVRKEQRVGDKAFLTGIQWCIEQRLKIFGVYAAQRVALTWEEEARGAGLDPDQIVEEVIEYLQSENS
jgi:hypothetical protein